MSDMKNNQTTPDFIRENVSLKDHSTFKIGGPARYFALAKSEAEARLALDFAVEKRLKVFVIGRGSNLLISDKGFDGLVLKYEDTGVETEEGADGFWVRVAGGVSLTKLALDCAKGGMSGLEWASGIPATVGGAVSNNAGAHGSDMSRSVESVRAFKLERDGAGILTGYAQCELEKAQARFSYRDSLFKESKGYLILSAVFALGRGDKDALLSGITENTKKRVAAQPLEYPNIGSIFRNPALSPAKAEVLLREYPEAAGVIRDVVIPAGWLIEQTELKGKVIGGAQVSSKHANFIVNVGGATAEDVVILISLIKEKIRVQFDLQLREEIEYVGF